MYGVHASATNLGMWLDTFMIHFVLGGLSGMMLAVSLTDIVYHDTYFVVGHFHSILGSAIVAVVPALIMEASIHISRLLYDTPDDVP